MIIKFWRTSQMWQVSEDVGLGSFSAALSHLYSMQVSFPEKKWLAYKFPNQTPLQSTNPTNLSTDHFQCPCAMPLTKVGRVATGAPSVTRLNIRSISSFTFQLRGSFHCVVDFKSTWFFDSRLSCWRKRRHTFSYSSLARVLYIIHDCNLQVYVCT